MHFLKTTTILAFTSQLLLCHSLLAEKVDYLTQIKPLLEAKCYACHGVLKQESGLRVDTSELLTQGGESGPGLIANEPAKSLLLERITDDEFSRMPPEGEGSPLKPKEVDLIRQWIQQGANAPHEDIPLAPNEHWAFLPITAPQDADAASIDLLLEKQRIALGLKKQPKADKSILIRRVYLDLVGLPPTQEQLHDQRPCAEIVDELLASPHYGERWGRHWMDIWRYSDWYGLGAQLRNSQKHLWHWRDWIVNSLNDDKGYDRMIHEMLAGDELEPENLDVVAGTGFLARNYYLFNRTTWLDSTIEHTGKAFLGLTLNCAKCHDHKYDPISQIDYYNFRAIFEPHQVRLDPIGGELNLEKDGLPRVFDDHLDAETHLHIKGDPTKPDERTSISPRVPELFVSFQPEIETVSLPVFAYAPALRKQMILAQEKSAATAVKKAQLELVTAQERVTQANTKLAKAGNHLEKVEFSFFDDFDEPRPDVWEITGSDWKYSDGTLLRTTSTRTPETVKYLGKLPRDFEATCQYTTTGGELYKSVTFRFDQSATYGNFVYTSAHAPGPKVQIAYTRNGKDTYPAKGRVGRPIEIGKQYSLRFAVKGTLVNVWLNEEFVLAYTLPDRQPEGSFSLSGFDATVAFDSIALRSLPEDFQMTSGASTDAKAKVDPEFNLKVAAAKNATAIAAQKSFVATLAADQAVYMKTQPEGADELKKAATIAQAKLALVKVEQELVIAGADEKKVAAATKRLEAAKKKLVQSESGESEYQSLRASRKALETPAHKETDYSPVYPTQSAGRRLSLARWMTDQKNPLTARVAVNHIWLRHFGEPLVDSVFDFGLRASEPKQIELLNFLAWEFMESGWSMKHLHRLIVTSEAYQLSSSSRSADPETLIADEKNEFYWRMNSRRMESQIIRDSLLQLAGTLDASVGGPSLDIGNKSRRRSIYYKHSRDHQDKFLSMFDDADLLQCYRRDTSIVPQQALALANSQISLTLSQTIAGKILQHTEEKTFNSFAQLCFEVILCRQPTASEIKACKEYSEKLKSLLQSESSQPVPEIDAKIRKHLVHSLLNHNDFISIR